MAGYGAATCEIVDRVRQVFPEHDRFLDRRFAGIPDGHAPFCEALADRILRIVAGRIDEAVSNYRWTCRMMLEEEYEFRRTGRYRHATFAQAKAAVYDDRAFMARYTDGLLLSQLLWANHAAALADYRQSFLPRLPPGAELLEVGPGHGLLLAMAAERLPGSVTGWDVSPTSLAVTERALAAMGTLSVWLREVDILDAPTSPRFDAVVASELLEHLDRPAEALARLRRLTRVGGRLFLNVPVNSPAPDHISLWRSPEEVYDLVTAAGLKIVRARAYPMTGRTERQACAGELTMSCVMTCERPADEAGDDE
jgi:SAM-dependent methyltransferase